jgi:hypothetical protein
VTLVLLSAVPSRAEWQIRPFLGATFGGGTTFVLTEPAGTSNVILGANGALLSNVFGVEVDFGYAPGFFESGDNPLVRVSRLTTLTGNVVITAPRRITEYTLGPYFVVGGGLMRLYGDDELGVFPLRRTLGAVDVGGGVTGNLSDQFGLNWDARYFRSVGGGVSGISVDPQDASERLSFWRASMALVLRYP